MRSFLIFLACCIIMFDLWACTNKKTIVTSEGTTTIETNRLRHTMKISNKRETAMIGRGAVTETELDLPLYPGAIPAQTGGLAVKSVKEGTLHQVSLTTKDSFDQVYQWYKQRLPANSEQTHMENGGGSIASFLVGKMGDHDQKSVLITQSNNLTTILLTHTDKPT
jgi:hypothetical protein